MESKAIILKPPLGSRPMAGGFGFRRPRSAVAAAVALGVLLILALASASPAQGEVAPSAIASQVQAQPTSDEALAQGTGDAAQAVQNQSMLPAQLPDLTSPQNFGQALQMVLLLTVLSLAPAILVLCTSFTRIIIVLSLLRQALGTQNLPPNQVLSGLALFMTFVVMAPTWNAVSKDAVQPYLNGQLTQQEALAAGVKPVRLFMMTQIDAAGNDETLIMFAQAAGEQPPKHWDDVSTLTLIPAFVLSELKIAFLMGFKVYLPFLVIDLVISAVLISMGMMMLPPVLISLPFKLLLFVLVDGWTLIVGSLMASFVASG